MDPGFDLHTGGGVQLSGERHHLVGFIAHHGHTGFEVFGQWDRGFGFGVGARLIGGGLFKLPLGEQHEYCGDRQG